ncbi:hypothetical protein LWI29_032729 [Acer saccharum]|uniref:Bulb-type lectin domain-containing protein n=1 Tax=Acer saccharum TaxID=4024 RepID=A0AA39SY83_ACESA|nr:hypothetical protein LWI29_032729 [Acer saccharum]
MATKGRIRMLLSFSCFLVVMGHSYSQRDKLLQGEELKDGDQLVSASGKFKLGFFTPSSMPYSSERYIGVWYYKPEDRTLQYDYTPQIQSTNVVWVANRSSPILHKSATLRIDSSDGNLKIFPNGENPIAITSVEAARNTSVTLEQSGNLFLHELHSNGSIKGMLWQSFDYPSDTLLPGMKLGINLKDGHKWFLQSWLTDDSPALDTVGMDPNVTNQLTIWWQGEIEGTSGHLLNGKFNSWDASGYNFSYNSNDQEKYFDQLFYEIFRMCNSIYSSFHSSFGMMSGDGTTFRESDNKTLDDCRLKCSKNCSCVAYAATNRENDTSCEIWSRGSEFIESNDGNSREIYVKSEDPGFAEEKWWIGLVIAAAVALALLVVLLYSLSYLARRKYKRMERPLNLVGYAWQLWNEGKGLEIPNVIFKSSGIANRNNPILHKSSTIRIDSSDGNFKIFLNGGNPVAITSLGVVRNITSVSLLNSGNLVLHVPDSNNGSIKHLLWQSFDYPTDTLLPEMKLGINFLTGHQWFLQSWLTYNSPEQGRFNVGMDPNVMSQLRVSCRGQGDQTSRDLLNRKFKSWNINGYKFSYFSNEQEKYFNYSVSEDVTSFSMLQIDWNGSLRDDRGQSIASCSVFNLGKRKSA